MVHINIQWCKGCGICVAFCPKKALSLDEMTQQYCPDLAITVEKKTKEAANG